jgi:predicted membrane protein
MRTPDLTAAQWLALVTWTASQAVAFGWLTTAPSQAVLSGVASVLAGAWLLADALIRRGRASVAAAAVYANPGAVTAALASRSSATVNPSWLPPPASPPTDPTPDQPAADHG